MFPPNPSAGLIGCPTRLSTRSIQLAGVLIVRALLGKSVGKLLIPCPVADLFVV